YIDYVIDMLHVVGPNANVIGICQPGPPVLAAVSLMSEAEDPDLPATMTFMGSPIDPRESPTVPNKIAMERSYDWFKDNAIYTVPFPNRGVMRRVYPGFLQLGGFISMNQERHVNAHKDYFNHLVEGDCDSVQKHREFYDEYLAVLDLTAEFYLQTIRDVFQEFKLPKRELVHRGRLVKPEAIKSVALMTVEGENDDISGIGQTQAAHDLCINIPNSMKIDYIQPGVGHYGVFSGTRYRTEIQPRMREFYLNFFNREREAQFQQDNPHLIHSS
ncbi:MAG TPA: polyhydroxyalkanoate depolymerase, partial [Cellvibrionaceae bacterium]|nr:polyhydroxyalkanoate depolymerase [Cellvibrionaceae bacterium]